VVPFIPIAGVTLPDCAKIAEWVAAEAWRRFHIPTYLYEAAARTPERKNLENLRRGQFEGLREEIRTNPDRRPDFGEAEVHPTAGATVVGARKFLIAYNINLNAPEVRVAQAVARKIRASSGGFPCVKAIGLELKGRGRAQVSINFTDFETTPIGTVFDAVEREAAAHGVGIEASEIVGLIPRRALEDAAVHYLKVENFRPELIFENRLEQVMQERTVSTGALAAVSLRSHVEGFVREVAADKPTPGGGSAAALAGALAAALGEMVCGVTLKRKSYAAHYPVLEQTRARLGQLRERLLENADRDAASYEAVMAALRLPKATETEQATRAKTLEEANKVATVVPLETAELAAETASLLASLRAITIQQAASDLSVAERLAGTARQGAVENVRTNLPSTHDRDWIIQIERRLLSLQKSGASGPPEP
jgi:glutamate formiminotransferase